MSVRPVVVTGWKMSVDIWYDDTVTTDYSTWLFYWFDDGQIALLYTFYIYHRKEQETGKMFKYENIYENTLNYYRLYLIFYTNNH